MTRNTNSAPGRKQDADLTRRILESTEQLLHARGFSGLRVEQVAQAVGCGKTAIYRRWATKEELAAAVVIHQAVPGEEPDTGTLIEDLVIHQEQSLIYQTHKRDLEGERPLWSIVVEPAVRDIVYSTFTAARRERGRRIVSRAVSRGEIPLETDPDALLDMIAGFSVYRTSARSEKLTRASFRQVASTVVGAPPLRIIP